MSKKTESEAAGNSVDRALAMLVLRRPDDSADEHGDSVSDEDLAALVDGTIDDTDRTRILHSIASNQSVYTRWLVLVEAKHTTDAMAPAPIAEEVDQRVERAAVSGRLIDKIGDWFKSFAYPVGGLLVAASVLMLVFSSRVTIETDTDSLYEEYSASSRSLLNNTGQLPTRAGDPWPAHRAYSPARSALGAGILSGLKAFGVDGISAGLDVDPSKFTTFQPVNDSHQDALNDLGRLAVLTYAQCQQDESSPFFEQAARVFVRLHQQLNSGQYDVLHVVTLVLSASVANSEPPTRPEICLLAGNLLSQFPKKL